MKIKLGKGEFALEGDFSNLENIVTKSIPEKISAYFQMKKEVKHIQLSMKNLHKECFTGLPKNIKFKSYILPIPRTLEQIKQEFEIRKYVDDKIFDDFSQKRLDEDYAELNMLQRFYNENGGEDNFVCFYRKGLEIKKYSLQALKKAYTYSKKDKAIFILEQFRKSDNVYMFTGYCTKSFMPKRL